MKNIWMAAFMLFTLGVTNAYASNDESVSSVLQVNEKDTFVGKWETMVKDTPIGDVKSIFEISKDKKGNITMKSNEQYTVQNVKCTDDTITIIADSEGHYCEIIMKIVDQDTLKGTAMEQWEINATRIK